MNLKDLHTIIHDAVANGYNVNSRNVISSALKTYASGRCLRPIRLRVFDSVLGTSVDKEVPCGCCFHCRTTKINEWVTRLYAHIEDFKYVYFVTLTYRSFTYKDLENRFNAATMDYLSEAYWHYDNYNSTGRAVFRPCLCCMSHLSAFLKRLRKNTGIKELTFFSCQEYGHKFGSPHYHLLLFSHEPISRRDVVRSWGRFLRSDFCGNVDASRNARDRQFKMFGRVQFDDLVANGTIEHKNITIHSKQYNVNGCFAYVAKYVGKLEFNKTRIRFAYNYYKQISKTFTYEVQDFIGTSRTLEDVHALPTFEEWSDGFAPRINCSRGTPIGSKFVARHIEEMANGTFATPPLQKENGTTCVRPSYFYRKAQEYLFSYRFLSENSSLVRRNLPQFAAYLAEGCQRAIPEEISHIIGKNRVEFDPASFFITDEVVRSSDVGFLMKHYAVVDLQSRMRYLIIFRNNHLEVEQYRYDRSLKGFVLLGLIDFPAFCESILGRLQKLFAASTIRIRQQNIDAIYRQKIADLLKDNESDELLKTTFESIADYWNSMSDFKNSARYQQSIL